MQKPSKAKTPDIEKFTSQFSYTVILTNLIKTYCNEYILELS